MLTCMDDNRGENHSSEKNAKTYRYQSFKSKHERPATFRKSFVLLCLKVVDTSLDLFVEAIYNQNFKFLWLINDMLQNESIRTLVPSRRKSVFSHHVQDQRRVSTVSIKQFILCESIHPFFLHVNVCSHVQFDCVYPAKGEKGWTHTF